MEQYISKYQKNMRCGITTGTCAAAAADAAANSLILGIKREKVNVHTPKGTDVTVPVFCVLEGRENSEYMVIKDSGDDPDVTNGAEIHVSVEKISENRSVGGYVFRDERYPELFLDGGIGIGRVTKKGLEQDIGQAAINAVPRSMIFQAVGEVCRQAGYTGKILVTVSIPLGEELSKRTFNPRLGIEGGLSVLGTSGIIEPMSERAIIDTIEVQIRQLHAQGQSNLLVTPGNYGQSYAEGYLGLNLDNSVKCSNYIGDTIDIAAGCEMKNFLLVGNIGKLVKLAAGIMNTHSKTADGRCEIFAAHTALCGGNRQMIEKIMKSITTDEIIGYLTEWGLREEVMQGICSKIQEYVSHRIGGKMNFGVILFSEKYGFLGQTEDAENVLREFIL